MDKKEDLDKAIGILRKNKDRWANEVSVSERINLLKKVRKLTGNISDKWIKEDLKARYVPYDNWDSVESVITGPVFSLRLLRLYIKTLEDIHRYGKPRLPGRVKKCGGGRQISIDVFPADIYDKLMFMGITGEIWLEPGYEAKDIPGLMAPAYGKGEIVGKTALVLGAGNVSGIAIGDILQKLLMENQVVLFKVHHVIDYLGDIVKEAFHPLIEQGFLQVVHGGVEEGKYLCSHPGIDAVHLTGSARTFEAIYFGSGDEGKKNKLEGKPLTTKSVTAELGNVSPVIVVPGPWNENDLNFHAENLASGLTFNSGFNCLANRVIVQHENGQRDIILGKLQNVFKEVPPNVAYYPGAENAIRDICVKYPKVVCFGELAHQKTPWTFLTHLDPNTKEEIAFQQEIFGSFLAETAISAENVPDYLEKAVKFCNDTLWGTLNATIIVHPKSLKDPAILQAVEKAIANLKYGTISINQFAGIGFFMGTTSWGGYPGATPQDVQSGIGVVHNTYMLEHVQKSVVRAPYKIWPTPFWFPMNKNSFKQAVHYLEFEKKEVFILVSFTVMGLLEVKD